MFWLQTLEDTVRIHPKDQAQPRQHLIKFNLNRKLANRVIHNIGLCMVTWDLKQVEEAFISGMA